MNDLMNRRLASIVSELSHLRPSFETAIRRFDDRVSAVEEFVADIDKLKFGADFWVEAAYRNAMIRLRMLIEDNFRYIETLSVLATARYVFETLVWLKLMRRCPKYGLIFHGRVISGQLQHFESLKRRLEDEINLFRKLEQQESELLESSLRELANTVEGISSDQVAAVTASLRDEFDQKARRHFSLYAEDARQNGFGFQSHLIQTQVIPNIDAQIRKLMEYRTAFTEGCAPDVRKKLNEHWNWNAEAKRVDMQAQYEFIYSFTSRLLHATPVSIFTDQKNLEVAEIVMFLEYVYVSMLDALDLAKIQSGSGKKLN